MDDLYRDYILEHYRHPHNFGVIEEPDLRWEGANPLCGDRLNVTLRLDGERLRDVNFEGQGCAISVASASLMTEAVRGKTRAEFARLYDEVHQLLTHAGTPPPAHLGKLAALAGVSEFPARVKCASLCWHTLSAALHDAGAGANASVSTE